MNPSADAPTGRPDRLLAWLRRTVAAHPAVSLLAAAGLSVAATVIASVVVGWSSATPTARSPATTSSGSVTPASFRRADLGKIWGAAFRGRATSHVSLQRAEAQANTIPAGASVDRQTNTIRYTGASAAIGIVASPPNGRDMTFRSAGLENPTINVPRGTEVTVRFVNGDSDSAHGWLLLNPIVQVGRSFHGPRAFPGAYAPILGDPTSQGQPVETIRFKATTTGTYRYECPVPGHASMGMQGKFIVTA
jgi:plastocyanin